MEILYHKNSEGKEVWVLEWRTKRIFAHKDENGALRFFNKKRYLWDEETKQNWLFKISMFELDRLTNKGKKKRYENKM